MNREDREGGARCLLVGCVHIWNDCGGGDPPPFQTPSSCPISNLMFAQSPVTPEPYDHGITDIIWQFLCLESCADA